MPRGKEFFNDQEVSFVAERIKKALGPEFERVFDKFLGPEGAKDLIRILPVSQRCRKAREEKGLTIKEAASMLKVPQYRLRGIEGTRGISVHTPTLDRYIDFLGLRSWFEDWKVINPDVYQRLLQRE
jgi:hypothetical protein